MKQEDILSEVLRLKKENPDISIYFCVDNDDLLEEYMWTRHKVGGVEILPMYTIDERILIGEDKIQEDFRDQLNMSITDPEITDEMIDQMVEDRYEKEVSKAICVFTHPG